MFPKGEASPGFRLQFYSQEETTPTDTKTQINMKIKISSLIRFVKFSAALIYFTKGFRSSCFIQIGVR